MINSLAFPKRVDTLKESTDWRLKLKRRHEGSENPRLSGVWRISRVGSSAARRAPDSCPTVKEWSCAATATEPLSLSLTHSLALSLSHPLPPFLSLSIQLTIISAPFGARASVLPHPVTSRSPLRNNSLRIKWVLWSLNDFDFIPNISPARADGVALSSVLNCVFGKSASWPTCRSSSRLLDRN